MHVLQVSSFMPPHPGGLELFAQNLADGLEEHGHQVRWVASAAPLPPGTTGNKIRVPAWNSLEERIHVPLPIWGPSARRILESECERADVVHVHDCLYPSSALAMLVAKRARRPVVVTQHIAKVPYGPVLSLVQQAGYHSLGRMILELADGVATPSPHVLEYFRQIGIRRPLELIQAGFDARFREPTGAERAAYRAAFGLPERAPVVLFVGRLVPKKGVDAVVEVQRTLAAEGIHLVVAGDGALVDRVRKCPSVTHLASVPYERMHELYGLADALLLPSYGEGLPLTVQEALLSGLPVVVSRDPSYVANLSNAAGVHMESSVDAWTRAVRSVLQNPPLRAQIAAWAQARWGKENFVRGYEALFLKAVASKRR